jgi:hypothetical protein
MIIGPMRQVINSEAPKARLVRLSSPPVVGGVFLAMQQVGINPFPLRDQLIKSTGKLLNEKVYSSIHPITATNYSKSSSTE